MTDKNLSIERVYGAQYVVEPGFTREDVKLLLKCSAVAAEFLPDTNKRYGCKRTRCKNLAYLPSIARSAVDPQAAHYNRKYKFGLVSCLDHHTFWPARESDAEDFKRGRLPFLWLEFLKEDFASDGERGKLLPCAEELIKVLSALRRKRKINAKLIHECAAALGLQVRILGRKLEWSPKE